MYEFKYLAFLEPGELIVPKRGEFSNLADMLAKVKLVDTNVSLSRTSYCFRWITGILGHTHKLRFLQETRPWSRRSRWGPGQIWSSCPTQLGQMFPLNRAVSPNYPLLSLDDNWTARPFSRPIIIQKSLPLNCFGRCSALAVETSFGQLQYLNRWNTYNFIESWR